MDPSLRMEIRMLIEMDQSLRRIQKRKPKVSTSIDTLVALDSKMKIMSLIQFFSTLDSFE